MRVGDDRPASNAGHRYVAILEDDEGRVTAMREQLGVILRSHEIMVFDVSQDMIEWLKEHASETELISLDHDLPISSERDHGCGRDIANYLAERLPTCPVIVHSSNDVCASGMFFARTRAGWPCKRIYPRDDLHWITTAWSKHIRTLVSQGWFDAHR